MITNVSCASSMLKRQRHTQHDLLRPQKTKEVVHLQQKAQMEKCSKAKFQRFTAGVKVLAQNYTRGVKWIPTTAVAKTGPVLCTVETSDHFSWRRHVDQLVHSRFWQ